jgi:alpha-N-arabinofuranosidase
VNGGTLTLTVVNPHATEACDATIGVRGGRASAAQAMSLSATDIHAHNTFERPADVVPAAAAAISLGSGGVITHRFPAASVTRLTVTLG